MIERALDARIPFGWITADEAYGQVGRLRMWLEPSGVAHVLAVPKSQMVVSMKLQRRRAHAVISEVDASAWQHLSCGDGAHGPRVYDWAVVDIRPLRDGQLRGDGEQLAQQGRDVNHRARCRKPRCSSGFDIQALSRYSSHHHCVLSVGWEASGSIGYCRRLVGGVVVEHQVQIQTRWGLFVQGHEELCELVGTVAAMQRPDHLPRREVEGREQGGGAGAHVVGGHPLWHAGHYRQYPVATGPVPGSATSPPQAGGAQSTQNTSAPLRWIEIQAHHVVDLVDEERIGRA